MHSSLAPSATSERQAQNSHAAYEGSFISHVKIGVVQATMRNLRNVRFGRWRHADITHACWDSETDELLCTVGPTAESSQIELVRVSDKDTM